MTSARMLRVKTGFARKAAKGRGIGANAAVAAAEARIEGMREEAMVGITAIVRQALASRPAIAAGQAEAFEELYRTSDALMSLCGLFDLSEVHQAALSLCELLDAAKPGTPSPDAVRVHLDAIQLFWSATPEMRAASAEHVLAGLKRVATLPGRKAAGE